MNGVAPMQSIALTVVTICARVAANIWTMGLVVMAQTFVMNVLVITVIIVENTVWMCLTVIVPAVMKKKMRKVSSVLRQLDCVSPGMPFATCVSSHA